MGNQKSTRKLVDEALENLDSDIVKKRITCPLSQKIYRDPITLVSTQITYERTAITAWFSQGNCVDPITGQVVQIPQFEPNLDLMKQVQQFLSNFQDEKANVFPTDTEEVHNVLEEQFERTLDRLVRQQADFEAAVEGLKSRALKIFRRKGEEGEEADEKQQSDEIEYSEDVFLETPIPIVTFMGPSRIGKSTLLNDLMNGPVFGTDGSPSRPCTEGAWISFYESEEFRCLLVDMEGLSHGVTDFTKALFYSCYAISNVVVWNTRDIGSDEFKNLMQKLRENMTEMARADKKPSFLLLERDFDEDDFDSDDYAPQTNLTDYIRHNEAWSEFNRLKLFSDVQAFSIPKRRKKKRLPDRVYNSLMEKVQRMSENAPRFATTVAEITDTLRRINSRGELSVGPQMLRANDVLGLYLLSPNDGEHHLQRRKEMTGIAVKYNWDADAMQRDFLKENDNVLGPMLRDGLISKDLRKEFRKNFQEVRERVENRIDNLEWISNWTTTAETVGGVIEGAAIGAVAAGETSAVAAAVAGGAMTAGAAVTVGGLVVVGGAVGLGIGYVAGVSVGTVFQGVVQGVRTLHGKATGHQYMRYSLGPTNAEKAIAENPSATVG